MVGWMLFKMTRVTTSECTCGCRVFEYAVYHTPPFRFGLPSRPDGKRWRRSTGCFEEVHDHVRGAVKYNKLAVDPRRTFEEVCVRSPRTWTGLTLVGRALVARLCYSNGPAKSRGNPRTHKPTHTSPSVVTGSRTEQEKEWYWCLKHCCLVHYLTSEPGRWCYVDLVQVPKQWLNGTSRCK
jgi:hypothetical protein